MRRELIWGAIFIVAASIFGSVIATASDKLKIPTLAPILRQVSPSVVALTIKRRPTPDELLLSGSDNENQTVEAAASGVIFDGARGLIVTCAHLLTDADEINVTLADKRVFGAERVGLDLETDVAVLKIAAVPDLAPIKFADSRELRVGDFVVSVGNPFGIGQSISFGVVSALRRTNMPIAGYDSLIQVDASMNPGDSGGALINLKGELVGIDTAIAGFTPTNVGIGFALPINVVRSMFDELAAHGEVRRGLLGVTLQDLTPGIATALALPDDQTGALVAMVRAGSAAEHAGIAAGDVIIAVDGSPVSSMPEARAKLGILKPGDLAHIALMRGAGSLTIAATLTSPAPRPISGDVMNPELAGAEFGQVSSFIPVAGAELVAVETDSRAWLAGFRKGDIIRSLNQEPVTSPERLAEMLKSGRAQLLFNVIRNGDGMFLAAPDAATR